MATIEVAGKTIEVDEEGYLQNREDWNKEIAEAMAKADDCELTDTTGKSSTSCVSTTTSTRSLRPSAS